jgi:hypothetical protein
VSVRLDESRPRHRNALADDVRGAMEALRRWVGEPVAEADTGERAIPRQKVPA